MTSQSARGESLIGQVVDGYTVIDEVAWSGTATVYRAMEASAGGRLVALKVIDALEQRLRMEQGDSENPMWREQRFSQVAKHPSLVQVFATGRLPDGRYYAAMEFVEGMSLAEEIAHRGAIPWQEAIVVLDQVASALATLHDARIVHRDLKPDNVLVRSSSSSVLRAKIIDFGLAKLVHHRDDVDSGMDPKSLATPLYLAPETARGLGTSYASDIYAMGAMAYEMLTGVNTLGLDEPSAQDCVERILSDDPIPEQPLRELAPGTPIALVKLVERCLARESERRPESGAVLRDALAPIVAAAPARPKGVRALMGRLKDLFGVEP